MLNNWVGIGRLVRDPELDYTQDGIERCKFSIAVDRDYQKDKVDFINIVTWRKTAEHCNKYLSKGRIIAVQGALRIDPFKKDGKTTYYTTINAQKVSFLPDGKSGNKASSADNNFSQGQLPEQVGSDDDFPF